MTRDGKLETSDHETLLRQLCLEHERRAHDAARAAAASDHPATAAMYEREAADEAAKAAAFAAGAKALADQAKLLVEVERLRAIEKAAHEMRDAVRLSDAYLEPAFMAFDALTGREHP